MATIKIKRSSTTGQIGPDANAGEISANLTDKQFYIGTGGNGVITFKDATQVTQEISTAIGGLSSAFEYKGTIDASTGTEAAPLSIEADKYGSDTEATGDYYKVSNAGYLKATTAGAASTGFYVNANDGIVYNGTGWDVIDNTNSTVAGTTNVVDVSGSTETGYTVNINSNFLNSSSTHVVDGGSY